MAEFIEILILSAIQGISEFIPVSSSAHLVLFSDIFNSYKSSVLMDASLHLGSLIAIIHYFLRDLINFSNNKKILNLIINHLFPGCPKQEFIKILKDMTNNHSYLSFKENENLDQKEINTDSPLLKRNQKKKFR